MKKIIIIIAALVLAVAIGVGAFFVIGRIVGKDATSPLENTMAEVFPEISRLGSFMMEEGELRLDAALSSDISKDIKGSPLELSLSFIGGDGEGSVLGTFGSGDDLFDLLCYLTPEEIVLYSERLSDSGLGIKTETLAEDMDASVFAPGSGSEYELDKETFDAVKENLVDLMDRLFGSSEKPRVLEEALGRIAEEVKDSFKVEEKKEELRLGGETVKVKVTYVTADGETMEALADALVSEWEGNEELRDYVNKNFVVTNGATAPDADDLIYDIEDLFYKAADDEDMSIVFSFAVNGKYLVALDVEANMKIEGVDTDIDLSVDFSADPSKDPDMDAELSININGKGTTSGKFVIDSEENRKTLELSFMQSVESMNGPLNTGFELSAETDVAEGGDYTMEAELIGISCLGDIDEDDRIKLLSATMKGRTEIKKDGFSLSVTGLRVDSYEQGFSINELDLNKSVFTLTGRSGIFDGRRPDMGKVRPLFSLTEADMDALGEKIMADFEEGAASVNSTIGYDLFESAPELELISETDIDVSYYNTMMAFDNKTGRLFVANEDRKLRIYDGITLAPLGEIALKSTLAAMDADSGRLIFAYDDEDDPYIYVYNAETLESERSIYLRDITENYRIDKLVCVFAKGDKLFFLPDDSTPWVHTADLTTGKFIRVIPSDDVIDHLNRPEVFFDRENGKVFLVEKRTSPCNLHVYDFETGELRMVRKNIGSRLESYDIDFTGSCVRIKGGSYYDAEGERVTSTDFFYEGKTIISVVYKDSGFQLSIEALTPDNIVFMPMICNGDGVRSLGMLGLDGVDKVIRTGSDTFVFINSEANFMMSCRLVGKMRLSLLY